MPSKKPSLTELFWPKPQASRVKPTLLEIFGPALQEMPRPVGSFGAPVRQMLAWASQQNGREFTTKDLFKAWRDAGGQPGQPDDKKAYMSFQTIVRGLVDPRGRGTPEQPLVTVKAGTRGRGGTAIFSWGAARPSKTQGTKLTPAQQKAGEFDDMDLGPAGPADQGDDEPDQEEPAGEPEPEGPADEEEPEEERPEVGSDEDEMDWVPPTGDVEDSGVPGAMARLRDEAADKLPELLAAAATSPDTDEAGLAAIKIFGRGKARTRDAILVAKQVALNLGRPDRG